MEWASALAVVSALMGDDPAYRRTLSLQKCSRISSRQPNRSCSCLVISRITRKARTHTAASHPTSRTGNAKIFHTPPPTAISHLIHQLLITHISTFFSGESHSQPHILRLLYHVSRKLGYTQNKTGVKSNLFYFLLLHPSCIERNCYGGTCHFFFYRRK